jgi:hypothetical protein
MHTALRADRKPHEISDIAGRLRPRFAWDLLADIEPPGLEVRIAILRRKAAVESVPHAARCGGGAERRPRDQPARGRPASIAAITAGSSGAVRGSNRVTFLPSAETTNFSKFQRMSPVWPAASATWVSSR